MCACACVRALFSTLICTKPLLQCPGVDIALFEIFKQHLLDKAEERGKESPPRLKLFAAGMLSSSIAQVCIAHRLPCSIQ